MTVFSRIKTHYLPEDFLDDLEIFFCIRLDRLEAAKKSAEYAALEQTAWRLSDRLEAALPEKGAALLNEFLDCKTNMEALIMEMGYRQGFCDGIRMIALGRGPWPEEVKS